MEIEDCRIFRKILHEFEIETCHKFNWTLYIMVCVMGVGLFFLYVTSMFLFLELRNSNSKVAPPPVKAQPQHVKLEDDKEKAPLN